MYNALSAKQYIFAEKIAQVGFNQLVAQLISLKSRHASIIISAIIRNIIEH